jgi:hypothetical protein
MNFVKTINFLKLSLCFSFVLIQTSVEVQAQPCPEGLVRFEVGRPTESIGCGKVISSFVLSEKGSPSCNAGSLAWTPYLACVMPYRPLPYGAPIPQEFNSCMGQNYSKGRMWSPIRWCSQAIQAQGEVLNPQNIQKCIASGRGNNHPLSPESYCEVMASSLGPAANLLPNLNGVVWAPDE